MDTDTEIRLLVFAILLSFAIAGGGLLMSGENRNGEVLPMTDARAWAESVGWVCKVQGHLSGDTVLCQGSVPLRLLLVDAPENNHGWIGAEAVSFLSQLLPIGTHARIELDRDAEDQYGRVLAYLYRPDGRMVNEDLVQFGAAVYQDAAPNELHARRIAEAEKAAKAERRGLWRYPAFECFAARRPQEICRTMAGGAAPPDR